MRKIILSIIMVGLLSFGLFGLDIFYDNFDNNQTRLNGWKESSSTNVTRYTGSYKVGSAAMELKGSSNATAYINIAPYKNMKLTYRMAKNSLESGEKLICQYNIGSGWVTAATLLNTRLMGHILHIQLLYLMLMCYKLSLCLMVTQLMTMVMLMR